MSEASQPKPKHLFPPQIVLQLHGLIQARQGELIKLNSLEPYTGFVSLYQRQYEGRKKAIENTENYLYGEILGILKKFAKELIVESDKAQTIINVLAALPAPHEVKLATIINARGTPVQ